MFSGMVMVLGVIFIGGHWIARTLRSRGLLWSCATLGLPAGFVLWRLTWPAGLAVIGASLYACSRGRRWHRIDLASGGDHAAIAESRLGIRDLYERHRAQQKIERQGWIGEGRLVVGRDEQGLPVAIPVGYRSGSHTLIVGATGAGKTVSEAWIACRLIDAGYGAITIDPKGDLMLHQELQRAAARAGVPFLTWTPEGALAYNPYAHGTDTEIADKALAGEHFTEPHYLRQAQRYLGHAVRVMHTAGMQITPASLMAHLDPRELEVSARRLPEQDAKTVQDYLDSLTDRQRRDLAGVRDRLSILAESDTRQWLNPNDSDRTLDLERAVVTERAVVYFRLDADRRPLLSAMLAGAIVGDLITLVARLQKNPVPTVVLIDEFSAIGAGQVARLFGRARSAGISLILATQELADLKTAADGALREQVLGNIATLIAHRQNVPESAETISQIASTKRVWITTQQTEHNVFGTLPNGRSTRRRGYEPNLDPGRIKDLQTGQAAVITPGANQPPTIVQIHHPNEA
jgi:conjugal transfer pilus assembly protein TraD